MGEGEGDVAKRRRTEKQYARQPETEGNESKRKRIQGKHNTGELRKTACMVEVNPQY